MNYEVLWKLHAVIMTAALASVLTGIVLRIVFRRKKWVFRVHRGLGIFSGFSGTAAAGIAVYMIEASGGIHLSSLHTRLGTAGALLVFFIPSAALYLVRRKSWKRFRIMHRTGGYLLPALMLAAALSGAVLMGIIGSGA